jgi:predicted NUDIX family NTP pyrophosphohydrolase
LDGNFIALAPLKQRGGKIVHAWAVEGDVDAQSIKSNLFTMEWPPRSGKHAEFPEVDRAGWFTLEAAKEKILPGQAEFLEELRRLVIR